MDLQKEIVKIVRIKKQFSIERYQRTPVLRVQTREAKHISREPTGLTCWTS